MVWEKVNSNLAAKG